MMRPRPTREAVESIIPSPAYDGDGAHACIRDDNERILEPNIDPYDVLMPLVDLTYKTRDTFCVHDFTNAAVGNGVKTDISLSDQFIGLQNIEVYSLGSPIKNGDVVITKSGKWMAFDVAAEGTQGFHSMIGASYLPEFSIGHPAPNA